jgi:hypothetical protein
MPIRFVCENCGARLSVSSRKAGTQAKCPKCHGGITVPAPDSAQEHPEAISPPAIAGEDVGQQQPSDDPFAQFAVYDVESELVYDNGEEEGRPTAPAGPIDPNKLAISRSVLYAQGILLGLVALGSFAIGVLVGLGTTGSNSDTGGIPHPCLISGMVAVQNDGGDTSADVGAVAVVVPRDVRPEQKADIVGLRPQDPPPGDSHAGLRAIRSVGGDYTRADEEGRFQLKVPDQGNYFLLVISASASRRDGDQPKTVLAQIGRFFQLTPDLFEGHAYRWQEEIVRRDRELNFLFP